MTILAARYFQLGSVVLATHAHRALDTPITISERRLEFHRAAYQDGGTDSDELVVFYEPRTIDLEVEISSYDADGAVSHAGGLAGQHRNNIDDLLKEVTKPGRIDFRQVIADPDSAGTLTLQGWARHVAAANWRGTSLVKRADLTVVLPYPFLHIGTVATTLALPAATSTPITLGGVAPVADMVFTFTAAGTITYDEGTGEWIQILTMPATGNVEVDVGRRTVTAVDSGADWRPQIRVGQPWWMRWPADSTVTLTTSGAAAGSVDYFEATW